MPSSTSRRSALALIPAAATLSVVGSGRPAYATIPAPSETPILTISGRIKITNGDGTARFDRAMLEAMGMQRIETTTPWHSGTVRFEGVPLAALMRAVGAEGDRVSVVALNDYSSEIPIEDFAKYNVILALKRDGEYMPVRDKGPLFVVYPYDSAPELKHQKFYSRSVWQVAKIVVR
jgi:hypothetical protein